MKTNLTLLKIALCMTLSLVGLTSCQKETVTQKMEKSSKIFSDVNPEKLKRGEQLTLDELWFKNLALYRLHKNVEWDGKQFILKANSGKELRISERLFNYYKQQMQATNEMLKKGYLKLENGKLTLRQLQSTGSVSSTTSDSEEEDDDPNRDKCGNALNDVDWDLFGGLDITLTNETVAEIVSYGAVGDIAAMASEFGGAIGSTAAGIVGAGLANINAVNNSANNGNGVTIHIDNSTLVGAALGGIGVGMSTSNPAYGAVTAGGIAVGFMQVSANEKAKGGLGC